MVDEGGTYCAIATSRLPRQDASAPDRTRYVDKAMIVRPAHDLATNRRLGGVMRARLEDRRALGAFRHHQKGVIEVNPAGMDVVP